MDITTRYMGFQLKNPVIAGSSGLTNNVENIIELEKHGAAAIVLKSLFEEQIIYDYHSKLTELKMNSPYPEAEEFISKHTTERDLENYLDLIRGAKKSVSVPVIASLNCVSLSEWTVFAREVELAGADGIELNLFIMPSDTSLTSAQIEEIYVEIINDIIKKISIPLSLKVSGHFSGMARTMLRFSFSGIKNIVFFNRFFSPDIDIEELKTVPGGVFSSPADLYHPLRWIALLSDRIYCDIVASTGVHDGQALVKVLLAGARASQVCSALYQEGYPVIKKMLTFLEDYMQRKGFNSLDEIIGKMSIRNSENPASYERVQFMQHFSGIE